MAQLISNPITHKDWQKLITLVTYYVDATDDQTEEYCRKKVLRYLTKLNKKYPYHVKILATKADYVKSRFLQKKYLTKAYQLAEIQEDHQNLVLLASSFIDFYEEFNAPTTVIQFWIIALEQHLQSFPDELEYQNLQIWKNLYL